MAEEQEKSAEELLKEQYDHTPEPLHVTKPKEPVAEVPKTPRKHPASLVRLAMKYGASREEIEQASTGDLSEWIEEQEILREREREANFRNTETRRAVEQSAAPKTPVAEEDEIDWGTDETGQPIKESDILPGLRNVIKAQHKKIKDLSPLKSELEELSKREQARSSQAARDRIEDGFASLDEKYQKLFGNGVLSECSQVEQKRRIAILSAIGVDLNNAPSAKVLANKIKQSADELFGLEQEEAKGASYADTALSSGEQPKKINGRFTEKQFEEGTLSRTSQRQPKEEKGKKLAVKKVAEKMREMGMTDEYFNSYESDGLPE